MILSHNSRFFNKKFIARQWKKKKCYLHKAFNRHNQQKVLDLNWKVSRLAAGIFWCDSLSFIANSYWIFFLVMLEEVIKIRSITCGAAAMPGLQIVTPCASSSCFVSSTRSSPPFFIITLAVATRTTVPQRPSFFSVVCTSSSLPLVYVWHSRRRVWLLWQRWVTAEPLTWGREMRGDWVVLMNYWLISDLVTELYVCFVLHCVSVTDRASGIVIKKINT